MFENPYFSYSLLDWKTPEICFGPHGPMPRPTGGQPGAHMGLEAPVPISGEVACPNDTGPGTCLYMYKYIYIYTRYKKPCENIENEKVFYVGKS